MRLQACALVLFLAAVATARAGPIESGREVYERYCTSCHGIDGRPVLPGTPDFTRGDTLMKTDQQLMNAIRFGVNSMPGFDQTIDNKGLIDVLFYIRTLQR